MATTDQLIETLPDFLLDLREAGYDIGVEQSLNAQNVLLGLAAQGKLPDDPNDWHSCLAPVLC
ncbi:MAG: hypothetical protein AAF512_20060, partial [Pseudomonadota bacterium]